MFMSNILYQTATTRTRQNSCGSNQMPAGACLQMASSNSESSRLPKNQSQSKIMADPEKETSGPITIEVTVDVENTSLDEGILDVHSSTAEEDSDDSLLSTDITSSDSGNSLLSDSTGSSPLPPSTSTDSNNNNTSKCAPSNDSSETEVSYLEVDQPSVDQPEYGNNVNGNDAQVTDVQQEKASNRKTTDVQTISGFKKKTLRHQEEECTTDSSATKRHVAGYQRQSQRQMVVDRGVCCCCSFPSSSSLSSRHRAMVSPPVRSCCLEMCPPTSYTSALTANAHRHRDLSSKKTAHMQTASTAVDRAVETNTNLTNPRVNFSRTGKLPVHPRLSLLNGPETVRTRADHEQPSRRTANQQQQHPPHTVITMPISDMGKVPKMWRQDPTAPFTAKERPVKPIKFNNPSVAKNMANAFRDHSPLPSPTLYPGMYMVGNDPIVTSDGNVGVDSGGSQATLKISEQTHNCHLPLSPSFQSVYSLNTLRAPTVPSTPSASSADFVPIFISPKEYEEAFSSDPPPHYGISFEQSVLDRGACPNGQPSISKGSPGVKRNQSLQERLTNAFARPKKKAPLSARLSILGKPLPTSRTRQIRFHKERILVYNFLQRPHGFIAYAYHSAVALIIILGLLWFALSTVPDLEPWALTLLRIFDIMIISILTGEFITLFWASSCVYTYQGWKGKLAFVFSPFRLLDLLIIGVTAVVIWACWLSPHLSHLVWLRCGVIFQMLRLENRFRPWRLISSVLYIERKHLLITAYMGFLILVIISYVVYFLEQSDPETDFKNIPTSLYYGVITVCTIGYGDLAPKTTAGRIIGAILAICGAIIYAIPAGIIATGLALKVQERTREKHINKRRIPAARLIQWAWRVYSASANSVSEATWKVPSKNHATRIRKLAELYNGSMRSFGASRFTLSGEDDHHHHHGHHSNGGSKVNSQNDLTSVMNQLTSGQLDSSMKNAIRFIRAVKLKVALTQFKLAFKPYDIKDVMQQYSEGHHDVVGRVRYMQNGIHTVQGALNGVVRMMTDMQTSQTEKIERLERTVQLLVDRLTMAQSGGAGGHPGGHCHHPQQPSPYHYSDTSTLPSHTPRPLSNGDFESTLFIFPEQQHKSEIEDGPKPIPPLSTLATDSESGHRRDSSGSIYSTHSYKDENTASPSSVERIDSRRHRHFSS